MACPAPRIYTDMARLCECVDQPSYESLSDADKARRESIKICHPHIGMVPFEDGSQLAVADIPGIIEDAHRNKVFYKWNSAGSVIAFWLFSNPILEKILITETFHYHHKRTFDFS